MQQALELARRAAQAGEVPIGALVVRGNSVIGRGGNAPIDCQDPTAHAEILALREAARHLENYRLPGCRLYVTLEPCTMCAGALIHARIEELIFAAREPRSGAVVSTARVLENPHLNHRVKVLEGVAAEESAQLLKSFFRNRRGSHA